MVNRSAFFKSSKTGQPRGVYTNFDISLKFASIFVEFVDCLGSHVRQVVNIIIISFTCVIIKLA